ncbi:MAG: carboxymuconolactone decarboxylase family protein [Bacteroidetes bacterium]|nr:carboxymuconolactone decarboxylase family protein [Bacteroidota bacterium]
MTRIKLSDNGISPFEKLIGHNKIVLEKWTELEIALFTGTKLDKNLLEQVRRTIAFENECEYCMVKAGKPNFDSNQKRINTATAFAQLFAIDHKLINDSHFDILREEFTEKEISELCSFISFITACQKLGRIYNLTEEFQINKTITMTELNKTKMQ